MFKVIVSQKKVLTLNHWNVSLLKRILSRFMLTSAETLAYFLPTCWSFRVGLNENANPFFATRCPFGAVKIAVAPEPLYTKQQWVRCFIRRYRHDEMKMRPIGPITADQRHAKGGVWTFFLLNDSFGSSWARKVKINAYEMKVFLTLHACQPVVGDSQIQNMNPIMWHFNVTSKKSFMVYQLKQRN